MQATRLQLKKLTNPKSILSIEEQLSVKDHFEDKVILITGAGGSIGSILAKRCLEFNIKRLILVEHSEVLLHTILAELASKKVKAYLLNILFQTDFKQVFKTEQPQIVFHAAAYKHVPLGEQNIKSVLTNNILGTKICADLSIKNKVEHFINISTDKVIYPITIMGASKRIGEIYINSLNSKFTKMFSVRFGNIFDSSGSVIATFKKQLKRGERLSVSHKKATRYFTSALHASDLILWACTHAQHKAIIVQDMGEPVFIDKLAKIFLQQGQRKPSEIDYIGLRPGDKLHEENLITNTKPWGNYFIFNDISNYSTKDLDKAIKGLLSSSDPKAYLKKILPEYSPK